MHVPGVYKFVRSQWEVLIVAIVGMFQNSWKDDIAISMQPIATPDYIVHQKRHAKISA